jgi:mannosyltransferase
LSAVIQTRDLTAGDRAGQHRRGLLEAQHGVLLAGVVVLGAILRFGTLDVQSYWDDEGYTVALMRLSFVDMLREVPDTESAPHVYYVCAWLWSQVFGIGEVGLRSLSALVGTAAIVLVYMATRELASRTAGVIAAAAFAVNPLLVWYSQEARAYSLLVLLTTGSLLFFARSLNRQPGSLMWWAIVSSLALATHYFALFVVAAEALVLLWRRGIVHLVRPLALVAATALVLLPLALVQRGKEFGFAERSLSTRIAQIPEQFLVGYGVWSEWWGKTAAALAAIFVGLGLVTLLRPRTLTTGSGPVLALAVGLTGLAAPIVLAILGLDYVLTLYFLGTLAALTAAIASGWTLSPIGRAAAVFYCVLSLVIVVVVNTSPQFQRQDLRGAAQALGSTCDPRAIVVSPEAVLTAYMPHLRGLPSEGARVREVALLGMAIKDPGERASVPRDVRSTPPGFRPSTRVNDDRFTVLRFHAPTPRLVHTQDLVRTRLGPWPYSRVAVLLEPSCASRFRSPT